MQLKKAVESGSKRTEYSKSEQDQKAEVGGAPGREKEETLRKALDKVVSSFKSMLEEETSKKAAESSGVLQKPNHVETAVVSSQEANQPRQAVSSHAPVKLTLEMADGQKKIVQLVGSNSKVQQKTLQDAEQTKDEAKEETGTPVVASVRAKLPQQQPETPEQEEARLISEATSSQWKRYKTFLEKHGGKKEKGAWVDMVEGAITEGAKWRELLSTESARRQQRWEDRMAAAYGGPVMQPSMSTALASPLNADIPQTIELMNGDSQYQDAYVGTGLAAQAEDPRQSFFTAGSPAAVQMTGLGVNAVTRSQLAAGSESGEAYGLDGAYGDPLQAAVMEGSTDIQYAVDSQQQAQAQLMANAAQEAEKVYLQSKQKADAAAQTAWKLQKLVGNADY